MSAMRDLAHRARRRRDRAGRRSTGSARVSRDVVVQHDVEVVRRTSACRRRCGCARSISGISRSEPARSAISYSACCRRSDFCSDSIRGLRLRGDQGRGDRASGQRQPGLARRRRSAVPAAPRRSPPACLVLAPGDLDLGPERCRSGSPPKQRLGACCVQRGRGPSRQRTLPAPMRRSRQQHRPPRSRSARYRLQQCRRDADRPLAGTVDGSYGTSAIAAYGSTVSPGLQLCSITRLGHGERQTPSRFRDPLITIMDLPCASPLPAPVRPPGFPSAAPARNLPRMNDAPPATATTAATKR